MSGILRETLLLDESFVMVCQRYLLLLLGEEVIELGCLFFLRILRGEICLYETRRPTLGKWISERHLHFCMVRRKDFGCIVALRNFFINFAPFLWVLLHNAQILEPVAFIWINGKVRWKSSIRAVINNFSTASGSNFHRSVGRTDKDVFCCGTEFLCIWVFFFFFQVFNQAKIDFLASNSLTSSLLWGCSGFGATYALWSCLCQRTGSSS